MLKKINLNYGDLGWQKTWAWVDGNFGIHRDSAGCGWLLTHVPTGMMLGRDNVGENKADVLKSLDRYKNFRWRGVNPLGNFAPCELLNIAPLIYKEQGVAEEANEFWVDHIQDQAARALECQPRAKGGE